MPGRHDVVEKSATAAQLIAYLSLAMLAAAFGAMVGPAWSRWWAIFGAFGLASALGLDVLSRSRARLEDHRRGKQIACKVAQNLDKMVEEAESSGAIRDALRHFREEAEEWKPQGTNGQAEPRVPLDRPVTITCLRCFSGDESDRVGEPLAARLRNISRHGFGLVHDQRLGRGPVLLEVALEAGEPLRFIADVLWCELQESGDYHSGGKILELANPSEPQPAALAGAGERGP